MNAKFEWFGFSVARRHVYFYLGLTVATVAANTMKAQFSKHPSKSSEAMAHLSRISEQVATLRGAPPKP